MTANVFSQQEEVRTVFGHGYGVKYANQWQKQQRLAAKANRAQDADVEA